MLFCLIDAFKIYWANLSFAGFVIGAAGGLFLTLYEVIRNKKSLTDEVQLWWGGSLWVIIVVWRLVYAFSLGTAAILPLVLPSLIFHLPNYTACLARQMYKNYFATPFTQSKPSECPVCYEPFEDSDKPLSCGHYIHRECIVKSRKTICCLCKQDIFVSALELLRIQEQP